MRNGRQLGGSNELGNGRQGWPIRTSLLSRLFFPPPPPLTKDYFSTAVRHYAELFTSVSAGIRRKATGGCGVRLHLMLKKTLNEVTNHTDFMKHECIMSVLWLEALQQLV